MTDFVINFTWHPEDRLWVADGGNERFGVATEAPTVEALFSRLAVRVQDLLEDEAGG
jgi:hypothetical protein